MPAFCLPTSAARLGFVLAALLVSPAIAGPEDVLRIDGAIPTAAVVAIGEELPHTGDLPQPPPRMLLDLRGALAILDQGAVRQLLRCIPGRAKVTGVPPGARRLCVIHLHREADRKRVAVWQSDDGIVVAEDLDSALEPPPRVELIAERFDRLSEGWSPYRGGFERTAPAGEVFELEHPYTFSPHYMSKSYLGERFLRRDTTSIDATTRVLANETMFVRLPRGYDPLRPAGLIVWIDPTDSGRPPQSFFDGLDAGYLVCIGAAGAGNARHVADRYQLAMDCLATARARFHIDPARCYISGMSGGGRISSQLVCVFPDEFTGAIPIVGLSCYEPVPAGNGRYWPAAFREPEAARLRLLQQRRIGAMSGPHDRNFLEMQGAVEIMAADRIPIRLFAYDDMGHTMPTPQRFAEVARWVDAPARENRAELRARATGMLERAAAAGGEPLRPDQTALLLRVIDEAPWTPEAWEAIGRLGVEVPAPDVLEGQ
ncbi:MAG: hypothetical protein ACF8R7_14760 [Phycisphaerales bacterium JB039]